MSQHQVKWKRRSTLNHGRILQEGVICASETCYCESWFTMYSVCKSWFTMYSVCQSWLTMCSVFCCLYSITPHNQLPLWIEQIPHLPRSYHKRNSEISDAPRAGLHWIDQVQCIKYVQITALKQTSYLFLLVHIKNQQYTPQCHNKEMVAGLTTSILYHTAILKASF